MISLQVIVRGEPLMMAFFDIRRCHFHEVLHREVFADLLDELHQKLGPDVVAKRSDLARRRRDVGCRTLISSRRQQRSNPPEG